MGFTIKLPPPKILVLRHRLRDPAFYDQFLHWLVFHYPDTAEHFFIHDLPDPIPDNPRYCLLVPWLQDPVEQWSPTTFQQVVALSELLGQRGIRTVNRLENQANSSKCRASEIIRSVGFRTPRMVLIQDVKAFLATPNLPFPFIVRENEGHRGPMIRVTCGAELERVPWKELFCPVAVEFVDVADPNDGLYRKFRYTVCGQYGVSHHMVVSENWITHGDNRLISDTSREEELEYLRQEDPHREAFFKAAAAMELDLLAFDYGYDREGRPVVWEANPYPSIQFGVSDTIYRNAARHRTFRCMLAMYLDLAGLNFPAGLEESLKYPMMPDEEAHFATFPSFLP
ncbi:MAG TPA: hypothetical protein PLX06_02995 [Fimbriimonadaceae bacterium]|nr:hypothetical protein [Fimbriimonadaceae bacterium]